MHLRELRIRAMDGSVIVDGVLRLETDEPAAATLPSRELRFIGVNLPEARFGGPSFQLFNEIQRAKDGFWGASAPLLTVHFEEGMLDIQRLLTRGLKSQRFEIHDELRVGSVAVRYPRVNAGDWRDLYGHVRSLQLSLAVENDGLRISFNAPVEPMAFREEAPVFTRARLIGDVLVPSEYWRIRGMAGAMWAAQNNARVGEWSPDTAPLGAAAFGEYGEHFSSGRLDWGQPADDLYPPGQFVGVRLSPHQMTLRSAGELSLLANGFASRRHHHSGGPELTLFLGSDDRARIFEIKDEAELELRGAVARTARGFRLDRLCTSTS